MSIAKHHHIFHYCFAGLSLGAIFFSLAGYFGRLSLYFEFASGYKLQFLLISLCCGFYFLLTRKRFWLAVNLACVLLNLAVILPWYFNRVAITNPEQYAPLKVLSYNVLWKNKAYQKAIALIEAEQPDIAVFQEAVPHWHKSLAPLNALYPYHFRAKKLEIEVFSKLPLIAPQIKLYGTYRGMVIADLKIGQNFVEFIATHAYPQLYFGHTGWEIRNRHLEEGIGDYVGSLNRPAIVIGDLNVSLWSPFYHTMVERSGLHNARLGRGILPTHSIVAPQIAALSAPIDHCLITPDIQVKDFRLGKAIGSDHLPIIAELLIPNGVTQIIKK